MQFRFWISCHDLRQVTPVPPAPGLVEVSQRPQNQCAAHDDANVQTFLECWNAPCGDYTILYVKSQESSAIRRSVLYAGHPCLAMHTLLARISIRVASF